jgi:hypothetical protein
MSGDYKYASHETRVRLRREVNYCFLVLVSVPKVLDTLHFATSILFSRLARTNAFRMVKSNPDFLAPWLS